MCNADYHSYHSSSCFRMKLVSDVVPVTGCSDSLASLARSPLSSVGRASVLQAEGRGFESYSG